MFSKLNNMWLPNCEVAFDYRWLPLLKKCPSKIINNKCETSETTDQKQKT